MKEEIRDVLTIDTNETGTGITQSVCRRATGWMAGVSFPVGARDFFYFAAPRLALGPTQPSIQWVPGAICPGVKRPEREADHLPPVSAGVNNTWIYTSTPPYAFMVECLISLQQGQLYLIIFLFTSAAGA
jgi:hypothetical protein